MKNIIIVVSVMALANAAWAANLASDDASDPAYSGGWTNGSNGGSGFGAWQLSTFGSVAGHFIGSSTQNADGSDDGTVNGLASDRDINTGTLTPAAWGMYADTGGNNARAVRPFTGGPLDVGQVFAINFDNGYLQSGGSIAVGFRSALNVSVFAVGFIGGGSTYEYNDASGTFNTGIGYGDEGLNLTVTMTGPTNYQAKLTRFDGTSTAWSGTMSAAPVSFYAESNNVGPGSQHDFFINSMSIVPEPSSIALGTLGLLVIAVRSMRRHLVRGAEHR